MTPTAQTLTIGIDCGKSGAIALLYGDQVSFSDTPTIAVGKTKREYDCQGMARFLGAYGGTANGVQVTIEKQQAMPKQGVSSTFQIGYGYGLWVGIMAALGIPYTLIHPRTWKAAMMRDMPKEKGASVLRALQLFPHVAPELKRKRDHNRADALLLAEYLRRQNGTAITELPNGGE